MLFRSVDAAAVSSAPNQIIPELAAAAKQMGQYVGNAIAARARGKLSVGPFRYHHQGDLATIGWSTAVVNLKHLRLTGMAGWLWMMVTIAAMQSGDVKPQATFVDTALIGEIRIRAQRERVINSSPGRQGSLWHPQTFRRQS